MDSLGSIVPNVQITAQNKIGKRFEAVTNEEGNYNLTLPEGIYTIQIIHSPFKTFIIKEYQVTHSVKKMELDVSLICEKCELIEHPSALSQN